MQTKQVERKAEKMRWADIESDDEGNRIDSLEVDNFEDNFGPRIDTKKRVLQSIEGPPQVNRFKVPEPYLRRCGGRRLERLRPQGERRDMSPETELMTTIGAPRIIIVLLRPDFDRRGSPLSEAQ